MRNIAVVGGGITGVTSAYALARRGFNVTLFERHPYAAMETSFANGGQLSASNAEVWMHPSTLLKGLKWMFRSDAPLLVSPRPDWHKLSWLAQFVWSLPRYRDNTIETARMAIAARRHLFDWAREEQIDFDLRQRGILHVYRDRAGFEHAGRVSKMLAEAGLERTSLAPAQIHEMVPSLAGDWFGGWFTPSDSTGDIHKFTVGLAQAAQRRGVKVVFGADVLATSSDGRQATLNIQQDGLRRQESFDAVVICAGVRSRAFAAQLGDRVNIYPVKGYSITVNLADSASRAAAPAVSLLDDEAKIVTSRLGEDRFRVAGTAEFAGIDHDIRADRIRPLVDWVRRTLPGVQTRQVVPWAGLRPMMPDMMPRVGRGRRENVFYNTGHGHLGWTLCAATAEMLVDVMSTANARKPTFHPAPAPAMGSTAP